MTLKQWKARMQQIGYWEERTARSTRCLEAHELLPSTLDTLRRDIDAGYRIAHCGWNGE